MWEDFIVIQSQGTYEFSRYGVVLATQWGMLLTFRSPFII